MNAAPRTDPIAQARRALRLATRAKQQLDGLPDPLRHAIFNLDTVAVTVTLSPQTLASLQEAIVAVEQTRDRLGFLLKNCPPRVKGVACNS
jgi:hypothetical protein